MTISVMLMGGHANQVWQLAAAMTLAGPDHLDDIVANCSFLAAHQNTPGITPRKYALAPFRIATSLGEGPSGVLYQESLPETYDPGQNYLLQGYFQDLRFFPNWVRDWFRERLPWRPRSTTPRACIHVRRGDYVTNPSATEWHGVMPLEYFVHHAKNLHQAKGINRFVIYSDDYEWCQYTLVPRMWNEISQGLSLITVERRDPWVDLSYMIKFDYHIISNSTFGWVAAYLSNTTQGVVYPKNWLTAGKPSPPIFPENWYASEPCENQQG
jgi:hypothetical protein